MVKDEQWMLNDGGTLNRELLTWISHPQFLMSTKCPSTAAATAMAGDTRWVLPPAPWRPSKLRLLVEAQRSPGWSTSAFIARHILQPGSRHSKPAAVKTR